MSLAQSSLLQALAGRFAQFPASLQVVNPQLRVQPLTWLCWDLGAAVGYPLRLPKLILPFVVG